MLETPTVSDSPQILIQANTPNSFYLQELYRCRELCYFFAWRDIKVRYKQSVFGLTWALIRPLATMVIFTLVFGYVAKLPSHDVSYPLFVLLGMMIWQLVSNVTQSSAMALISNAPLVTKVYFPRMTIPLSLIVINLLDFVICYCVFLPIALYNHTDLSWLVLLTPIFVLQAVLLSIGIALWCSAVTARYRDFQFIVQLGVQFGLFLSPVGYSSSLIPEPWIWLYCINPVVGLIDGLRWATFGIPDPYLVYSLFLSWVVTLVLVVTGYRCFRKIERTMADTI